MSAYLSMRAIDEIEDHPALDDRTKSRLLKEISLSLQTATGGGQMSRSPIASGDCYGTLPEVTTRIQDWVLLAPAPIAPRVCDATSAMADRMAHWAADGWQIRTKDDLDCYTFGVAGAVGLLLCDLWAWYDGTQTNRANAVGFGRGLQAVNILRNRAEDLSRGVDFLPNGWNVDDLRAYATDNLSLADAYVEALSSGPVRDFCRLPLALAYATLDALARGERKLTRSTVLQLIEQERSTLTRDRRPAE